MEFERVLQLIATVKEFTASAIKKKQKSRLKKKIPFEKSYMEIIRHDGMVNNKKIAVAKTFPHF